MTVLDDVLMVLMNGEGCVCIVLDGLLTGWVWGRVSSTEQQWMEGNRVVVRGATYHSIPASYETIRRHLCSSL